MSHKKVKKAALVEKPVSGLHVEANNRNMRRDFPRLGMYNVYTLYKCISFNTKDRGPRELLAGEIVLFHFQRVVVTFRPRQAPHIGLFSLQPGVLVSLLRRAVPAHGAGGRSRPFRNGIFQVPV